MEQKYNVISETPSEHHIVVPYEFKRLDLNNDDSSHIVYTHEVSQDQEKQELQQEPTVKNEVVTDELIQKMQFLVEKMNSMQTLFDSQSTQLQTHFKEDKQKSYEDGIKIGQEQAKEQFLKELQEQKARVVQAIDTLNQEAVKLDAGISNLENELAGVAIDIAKKVIDNELSKSSNQIALNLAKTLIKDLQEATNITIKTNIIDFAYIKENMAQNKKIKVEVDEAIAKGGIVIISDAGNIDATIKERFDMAKSVLFEDE